MSNCVDVDYKRIEELFVSLASRSEPDKALAIEILMGLMQMHFGFPPDAAKRVVELYRARAEAASSRGREYAALRRTTRKSKTKGEFRWLTNAKWSFRCAECSEVVPIGGTGAQCGGRNYCPEHGYRLHVSEAEADPWYSRWAKRNGYPFGETSCKCETPAITGLGYCETCGCRARKELSVISLN